MEDKKRKPRSDRVIRTGDELKVYNRMKQRESREKRKDAIAKWREEHREEINAHRKEHYSNNKEKMKEVAKVYREKNKEKIAARQKENYKNNREVVLKKMREYRSKNKDKCKKWHSNYMKKVFDTYKKYKAIEEIAKSPIAIPRDVEDIIMGMDFGIEDKTQVILCGRDSCLPEQKVS